MAVAAARRLPAPLLGDLAALYFATTTPAYLDKTNATAIHAALGLPAGVGAYDMGGAVRSATGLLVSALAATRSTLVVTADIRTGLPGSEDERDGGDGAAAFVVGPGSEAHPVLAERVGHRVGHRGVPGALAGARRGLLPPLGGSLRRARLPAPRRAGGGRRPGRSRTGPRRRGPPHHHRHPPPGRRRLRPHEPGQARGAGERPGRHRGQHRGGPPGRAAGLGSRRGPPRGGHRPGGPGRRRRRAGVPDHRGPGRAPLAPPPWPSRPPPGGKWPTPTSSPGGAC